MEEEGENKEGDDDEESPYLLNPDVGGENLPPHVHADHLAELQPHVDGQPVGAGGGEVRSGGSGLEEPVLDWPDQPVVVGEEVAVEALGVLVGPDEGGQAGQEPLEAHSAPNST